MLHSGSRHVGKELAERHIATARQLDHNLGLPDRDLAVFLSGSVEMAAYLHDLYWAQDYARLNREVMLTLVKRVVAARFPIAAYEETITCHHNYVSEETYEGVDVTVTREGAIRAKVGDLGLIPGSMGTGSYVVRGLGNEAAMNSASHGAGRRMSRAAAKRTFTVADLVAQTAGVECRKDVGVLDEIPGAYKDLQTVIDAQTTGPSPLVEVMTKLETLVCVKG
jgi:tRNA-splicing ligase RtcB